MYCRSSWTSLLHFFRMLYATTLWKHLTQATLVIPEKSGPYFAEPVPNITVAAGRDATLPCIVEDIGTFKVAWMHTDKHALLTMHDRVITRNNRYRISHSGFRSWWLQIRNVQEEDAGEYMCQINTSPMISSAGHFKVVVSPTLVENGTSSDTEVREGHGVSLRCLAKGSPTPTITWRREDGKEILLNKQKVTIHTGNCLNISHVNRLHMGAYLCIASNGVQPSVSKRIMLSVLFSPTIWTPSNLIGAPVDTDITLSCNVEAYPPALLHWTREDGEIIFPGHQVTTVQLAGGIYTNRMELRIKRLHFEDFGTYTCVAQNEWGQEETSTRLYEIALPVQSTTTEKVTTTKYNDEIQQVKYQVLTTAVTYSIPFKNKFNGSNSSTGAPTLIPHSPDTSRQLSNYVDGGFQDSSSLATLFRNNDKINLLNLLLIVIVPAFNV